MMMCGRQKCSSVDGQFTQSDLVGLDWICLEVHNHPHSPLSVGFQVVLRQTCEAWQTKWRGCLWFTE